MNHESILDNRATRTDEAPKKSHCEVCDEMLVFGLKDRHHTFSLGLTTVLECLRAAEQSGYVPPLSTGWWVSLDQMYHLKFMREQRHGCVQTANNGVGLQES